MNNRGERKHTDLLTHKGISERQGQRGQAALVCCRQSFCADRDICHLFVLEALASAEYLKCKFNAGVRRFFIFIPDICRRHGVQAEGLPGLHSLSAAERRHPGPGGEGEDHARGPTRLPGSLQQLRLVLPEPGPLCGESQRLPLRLRPVGVHRSLLQHR